MTPALTPIQTVALYKAVAKPQADGARDQVAPGAHDVDFNVRVHGSLVVGKDYSFRKPDADPWALLAAAMSKLNKVTLEQLIKTSDKLKDGQVHELKTGVEAELVRLRRKKKIDCKGPVQPRLMIELI